MAASSHRESQGPHPTNSPEGHLTEETILAVAEEQKAKWMGRLEINRANAQHSTGPRTEKGKSISKENSFKHGIYSKQLVIQGEDPAQLEALKADLLSEHQPATLTESLLVNEMAEHYWRMQRFRRLETKLMQEETLVFAPLSAVQRFQNGAERGFHKSLKTLREVQKERKSQDKPATVGEAAIVIGAGTASRAPAVSGGFVPHKQKRSAPAHDKTAAVGLFHTLKSLSDDSLPGPLETLDAECEAFEAFLRAA